MDKIKNSESSHKYTVSGVSGQDSIGHATKVFPIQANEAQKDLSKVKWCKKSMNGYDKKAYAYKY